MNWKQLNHAGQELNHYMQEIALAPSHSHSSKKLIIILTFTFMTSFLFFMTLPPKHETLLAITYFYF